MYINANLRSDWECNYFNINEEDLIYILKNHNPCKWQYTFIIHNNWVIYLHKKNTIRDNEDKF